MCSLYRCFRSSVSALPVVGMGDIMLASKHTIQDLMAGAQSLHCRRSETVLRVTGDFYL